MTQRRVVVTGLGIVSPVGNNVAAARENILAGKSGVPRTTRFDPGAYRSQIAGEVRDFAVTDYVPAKDVRRMDLFIHYGVAASSQAIRDSGIEVTDANRERIGCMVGSAHRRPADDRG